MRLSRLIFAMSLLLAAGLPARAASSFVDADHVRVELLVIPQGLNRGESADAGLYFKLEPGWHVYWKNPGDAGLSRRSIRGNCPLESLPGRCSFPRRSAAARPVDGLWLRGRSAVPADAACCKQQRPVL
jgi:hypothetical protein